MESMEKGKEALISSIEADATAEEEKILKAVYTQVEEKKKYAEKKVASILDAARKKAEEQAGILKNKSLSAVELEIKRHALHSQQTLVLDIMEQVSERLTAMIDEKAYRDVLIDWITEAALGLGEDEATINASAKERPLITKNLLAGIKQKIQTQAGREMTLVLSDDPPLSSQGVALTTVDGRIAFNNQVKTRIRMNQNQINKQIYNTLFSGNEEEAL